jgi:hypothetical protein
VNDELRAKFAAQGLRGAAALDAYDRFVTSLANSYGSGVGALACEDYRTIMQSAAAAPAQRSALLALAVRTGSDPVRGAERCVRTVALAR